MDAYDAHKLSHEQAGIRVTANDYAYNGWLVAAFRKRSGDVRCVVEDTNGRLFIHNLSQISTTE